MTHDGTRKTYSKREAAELLGVSHTTLNRYIRDGRIRTIKIDPRRGGRLLVLRDSLDALLSFDDEGAA